MKKIPKAHRTTFSKFIQTRLGDQIPSELLPRRLRLLGHVAILWLHPTVVPYKELIGQTVMEYNPKIRSVVRRVAAISGPYRQPALELIAGSPKTETSFKENNVIFHLDPRKVMFSLGNKAERVRMSKVGTNDFVIDMFAGIGQFSLPMAVHAKPRHIDAMEWNPDAYYYLQKNIEVNKVSNILQPHFGDSKILVPQISQGEADRVIMGLIQGTTQYLNQGISCLKPGGVMHLHEIGPRHESTKEVLSTLEKSARSLKRHLTVLRTQTIKTYNPQYTHFVIDVQID